MIRYWFHELTLLIEEKEEIVPDVDDTDGLDPAAEFEAWRLRELGRIKKEKEEEVRREEEREEIERRRAMPEEQRLREDMENAQKSRDSKPKGEAKFLQKYWHKGAFHQVSAFPSHFHTLVMRLLLSRTMKYFSAVTTRRLRSLLSMSPCFPKSCK